MNILGAIYQVRFVKKELTPSNRLKCLFKKGIIIQTFASSGLAISHVFNFTSFIQHIRLCVSHSVQGLILGAWLWQIYQKMDESRSSDIYFLVDSCMLTAHKPLKCLANARPNPVSQPVMRTALSSTSNCREDWRTARVEVRETRTEIHQVEDHIRKLRM